MPKKRNFLITLISTLPLFATVIACGGNLNKQSNQVDASVTPLGNGFFKEDYSGASLDTSYTKFDVRNGEHATFDNNGHAELTISNGSYRTTSSFSGDYAVDFDMYNSTDKRFTILFGNSPDGYGYAGGANADKAEFILLIADTFIRPFINGVQQPDIACALSLSTSNYSHFQFNITSNNVSVKHKGIQVADVALANPLNEGPVRITRSNSTDPNIFYFDNFSVQKPYGDYFVEDYTNGMQSDKTTFYNRSDGESCNVNNGEAVVTLNNGNFGTVNGFDSYIAKIRMYNAAESRVQFTFGNIAPATTGYAAGNNKANDNMMLVVTNTFVRSYVNAVENTVNVSTGLTNSSYCDFEVRVTSRDVRLKTNGNEIWSLPLNTTLSLTKGRFVLSRANLNPEYHIDSFAVQPLDYYFNETFETQTNEMVLYNRSGVGSATVANGQSTFTTTNDSYATRGEYYNNYSCEVVMKNTSSNGSGRIAFTIGGNTSPVKTGYTGAANMTSGMFRVFILATEVRWLENNGTINSVSVPTGLSQTEFNNIKFMVKDFVFTLYVNGALVFTHSLNLSTFLSPGQIIFARADAEGAINYVFDSIKVKGFESQILSASVNAVTESNPDDQNSIFNISLTGVDYASKNQINVGNAYISGLNTANCIRLNGSELINDLEYESGNKYLNFVDGAFSFVKSGNQRGFTYLNNGELSEYVDSNDKLLDVDNTIYEIEIAKGCEFPSYDTLSGDALIDTVYVTDRDYLFIWYEGAFHLADTFDYPLYKDIRIMNLSFTDKGGTNKALNLEFDKFNFPTLYDGPDGENFENIDVRTTQACSNLVTHISICMNDGSEVVVSTGERFINLWGQGITNPTFSVRVSEALDINKVDAVFIYEGAEFPSYNKYAHGKNELFRLGTTTRFLGDHEGNFYKATDITAIEYARDFYFAMGSVCYMHEELGDDETRARLEAKFDVFYQIYRDWMSDEMKAELSTSTDEEVLAMYERYNFIINKYEFENINFNGFLPNSVASAKPAKMFGNVGNVEDLILILSVCALFGCSVIAFSVIKRKKGNI